MKGLFYVILRQEINNFLSKMSLLSFGTGFIFVSISVEARAIDCTPLKTTNAPYQLDMVENDIHRYAVQIYRGADLTRRQLGIGNNHLNVARFQANFQLESQGFDGEKITTSYTVPTSKYIWDQGINTFHETSFVDGKSLGPGFDARYTMLPDEVMTLDTCSFPVKHYEVNQTSQSIVMTQEAWFSPELNTVLRMTIFTSSSRNGTTMKRKLEARSIDTKFVPFQ